MLEYSVSIVHVDCRQGHICSTRAPRSNVRSGMTIQYRNREKQSILNSEVPSGQGTLRNSCHCVKLFKFKFN